MRSSVIVGTGRRNFCRMVGWQQDEERREGSHSWVVDSRCGRRDSGLSGARVGEVREDRRCCTAILLAAVQCDEDDDSIYCLQKVISRRPPVPTDAHNSTLKCSALLDITHWATQPLAESLRPDDLSIAFPHLEWKKKIDTLFSSRFGGHRSMRHLPGVGSLQHIYIYYIDYTSPVQEFVE